MADIMEGHFRFTKWLLAEFEIDGQKVITDSDLSGWAQHFRERGIDAGANAYIVKSSFDQSNLLEVMRKLV